MSWSGYIPGNLLRHPDNDECANCGRLRKVHLPDPDGSHAPVEQGGSCRQFQPWHETCPGCSHAAHPGTTCDAPSDCRSNGRYTVTFRVGPCECLGGGDTAA